jgi:serine protease Do
MLNNYNLIKKSSYLFLTHTFLMFLTIGIAHSKGAPDSFADLAEKLSPSVVNISTTTIIEQKSREMPSFPPGSPFEDFFKQFEKPGGKKT